MMLIHLAVILVFPASFCGMLKLLDEFLSSATPEPRPKRPHGFWDPLWRFTRPHTVFGTAISILSVSLIAVEDADQFLSSRFWLGTAVAVLSSLFMNVYIVGLNQLYDIAIDQVNKPSLPLASRELTVSMGWAIVSLSGASSLWMGMAMGGTSLLWSLISAGVLGTVYSMPPFRLKRYPLFAALCIILVRGVVVQIGFFVHIAEVLGAPWTDIQSVPPVMIFMASFITVFALVIALFKDIPDIEGDRRHGVKSLSVRLGARRIFQSCVFLLVALYFGGAVFSGCLLKQSWSRRSMVMIHLGQAAVVLWKASRLEKPSHSQITEFYQFIWKLFYLAYLVFPFMR